MKPQIPIVPPSASDTAPVSEGHNSCEGNDCINYDFPFEMRVKGKKQAPPEKIPDASS
jgi:hypothetical protein